MARQARVRWVPMPWRRAASTTATPPTLRTVPSVAAMAVPTGRPWRLASRRVRPGTRRLASGGWMVPGDQPEALPVNPSTLVRSNSSTSAGKRQGVTSRPGRGGPGPYRPGPGGPGGRTIHGSRPWRSKPSRPRSSVPPASRTASSVSRPSTARASTAAGTPARRDRAARNTGVEGWVRLATWSPSAQSTPRAARPRRCHTDSPRAANATGPTGRLPVAGSAAGSTARLLGAEQVAEVDPGGRGPVGGDAGRAEAEGPGALGDRRDHAQLAVLGQLEVADADAGALAVLHADQQAGQAGQVGVGGQRGQEHGRLDPPAVEVAGEVGREAGPPGLGALVGGGRAGLGVGRVGLDPGRGG